MNYSRETAKQWANEHIKGLFMCPISPMNDDFTFDEEGIRENIEAFIEMGVDGQDIREMKLYDHFDQITIIRFSNIQYDAMPADANFEFVIPKGVDVVGEPK